MVRVLLAGCYCCCSSAPHTIAANLCQQVVNWPRAWRMDEFKRISNWNLFALMNRICEIQGYFLCFIKASTITCMCSQLSWLCVCLCFFFTHRIMYKNTHPILFFSPFFRHYLSISFICLFVSHTEVLIQYGDIVWIESDRGKCVYLAIIANLQGNLCCRHCIGIIAIGVAIAAIESNGIFLRYPFLPFHFSSILLHLVCMALRLLGFSWIALIRFPFRLFICAVWFGDTSQRSFTLLFLLSFLFPP